VKEKRMPPDSKHYVLADDDASAIWFLGTLAIIRADGARTGEALALVEFTHPAGFATPRHVHRTADEAFYVLEGSMRGSCGDQEWRASRGAFVWLPRGVPHGYAVEGDAPLRTLAFALPAGFDRFVVEAGEPAPARTVPPPGAPDLVKLNAAAARAGIENVGPAET
jgi:quercetin dioxygenase-like cupin family protein